MPNRPPLLLIKVWIEKVGKVLALVDTGASISAVKTRTVKYLENKREGKILKSMRGVDNKKVQIDGVVSLGVKWQGKQIELKEVAVVRSAPFALILGIDWIIASKTNIIVEEGLLKLKAGVDNESVKIEKAISDDVGGKSEIVEESCSDRKGKEVEGTPEFSDDFFTTIEKELPSKRTPTMEVKLTQRINIPPLSLAFISGVSRSDIMGTVMLKRTCGAAPGKEWLIPSSLVNVEKGKLKVPVLNLTNKNLKLKRKEVKAFIDIDVEEEVSNLEKEEIGCSFVNSEKNCSEISDFPVEIRKNSDQVQIRKATKIHGTPA